LAENYLRGRGAKADIELALYWSIYAVRAGEEQARPLLFEVLEEAERANIKPLGLELKEINNGI
jgi:TPR repeat protein